jgi:hypothetical protein
MSGKFENQLISVNYTDLLNGSVKCLIKSKLDLQVGMYGIYKNLKIIYSTESNYQKNNLVLCNNNTTEFEVKESDFIEILKAFQLFCEIVYFKKAAINIDGQDYIKHNSKSCYLEISKHTALSELIESVKPHKEYNIKQEPNKQLSEQPAIYEILQIKPYCINEPEPAAEPQQIENKAIICTVPKVESNKDTLLNDGIKNIQNINNTCNILLKRAFDLDIFNRKKYNELGAALLSCKDQTEFLNVLGSEYFFKESELPKELKTDIEDLINKDNYNIVLKNESEIYNNILSECPVNIQQIVNNSDYPEPPKVENITDIPKELSEPNKEFTNNCLKELEQVLSEVDNEVKVNKAFEVSSEVISKQVKVIKNLQKITFKIESYNERYIAITGQTYFIKDIIKRFKSKFFYNLNVNGIKKNAWILSKESESELKELLRKEV